MSNALAHEHSPYLLQHADNPVNWLPWSQQALELAQTENKPIFLSIGYAACHWCHVMAHESFEDPGVAAYLNAHFINIKVDREERPDIDSLYMHAVTALTGRGGWPLSVFLSPQGLPFYGGTYFPPQPRYGMPSFSEVIQGVHRYWTENQSAAQTLTEKILDHLSLSMRIDHPAQSYDPIKLCQTAQTRLEAEYDWKNGGWGSAPKFPQPLTLQFLLGRAQSSGGDLHLITHNLDQMMAGGMHDLIGGGFHRYSVDDQWLVPHFEKMLYDNALLARVYLHAYLATNRNEYRAVVEDTLDFLIREMRHPAGGFFSSLDADTPDGEGFFYTWTLQEVQAVIPDPQQFQIACAAYGFSESGHHEGRSIPRKRLSLPGLAALFNRSQDEMEQIVADVRQSLLQARGLRVRPRLDDKIITAWNSLGITAFSEAGRFLNRPDYLETARQCAGFLLSNPFKDGRLQRISYDNVSFQPAFLEDYAGLAVALLHLHQADTNTRWIDAAEVCMKTILNEFRHPNSGFYDDSDQSASLFMRPRELQDTPLPSGNSLAVQALLMLSELQSSHEYRGIAENALQAIQQPAAEYPTSFAAWLSAADFSARAAHIVLFGMSSDLEFVAMRNYLHSTLILNSLIHCIESDAPQGTVSLVPAFIQRVDPAKTEVFICRNFSCQRPVHTLASLIETLDKIQ